MQLAVFLKWIYRFNAIPTEILLKSFFSQADPKIHMEKCKESRIAKTKRKKTKVGGVTIPNSKT